MRSEIDYFMARKGIQENSFSTIIASGPNSAHSHHSNTDRKLKVGDPVICDFGVFWDGYCSDITKHISLEVLPQTSGEKFMILLG